MMANWVTLPETARKLACLAGGIFTVCASRHHAACIMLQERKREVVVQRLVLQRMLLEAAGAWEQLCKREQELQHQLGHASEVGPTLPPPPPARGLAGGLQGAAGERRQQQLAALARAAQTHPAELPAAVAEAAVPQHLQPAAQLLPGCQPPSQVVQQPSQVGQQQEALARAQLLAEQTQQPTPPQLQPAQPQQPVQHPVQPPQSAVQPQLPAKRALSRSASRGRPAQVRQRTAGGRRRSASSSSTSSSSSGSSGSSSSSGGGSSDSERSPARRGRSRRPGGSPLRQQQGRRSVSPPPRRQPPPRSRSVTPDAAEDGTAVLRLSVPGAAQAPPSSHLAQQTSAAPAANRRMPGAQPAIAGDSKAGATGGASLRVPDRCAWIACWWCGTKCVVACWPAANHIAAAAGIQGPPGLPSCSVRSLFLLALRRCTKNWQVPFPASRIEGQMEVR